MQNKLENIGSRLEYAFVTAGYDRRTFADAIEIHYETLGKHIRENTLPKTKATIRLIEQVTGFSAAWIETGQGDMMIERTGYREPDYVEEIFQTDLFKRGTYIQKRFEEIHRTTGEIYLVEITARRIEIGGDSPHEN